MSPFFHRARSAAAQLEVVDTTALRERILDAVEDAIDHAEAILRDAPSVEETRDRAVHGIRHSRALEAATPLLAAGAPLLARAVRTHMTTRTARRAAALAPTALRAHPAMVGAAVVGGVALGVEIARRYVLDDSDQTGSDRDGSPYDDEVARMQAEGGVPSGTTVTDGATVDRPTHVET